MQHAAPASHAAEPPNHPPPPCSHWFQMYSTLAMGATTHKVNQVFLVRLGAANRPAYIQQSATSAPLSSPAVHPPPAHAGHGQPQLGGARLLPPPPLHGLLLHLLRGAVPGAVLPDLAAVPARRAGAAARPGRPDAGGG